MKLFKIIKKKLCVTLLGGDYIFKDLSKRGAHIGKNVRAARNVILDDTRPYLLTIGDNTQIAQGVTVLTHDYSKCVLRNVYGQWIGEGAETVIGNNCFLGIGCVVLMGTHIGDNTIIGAGSVVHGDIPGNVVVAGNPAKVVCSLDAFYRIRKMSTAREAVNCAKAFYKACGRKPTEKEMSYFRFLFLPVEERRNKESNPLPPKWDGFDAFLQSVDFEDQA